MSLLALYAYQLPNQEIRRTMAAGPKDAIVMALPDVAASAVVKQMVWTANGSYLVVERVAEPPILPLPPGTRPGPQMEELVAWSRKTKKVKVLMSFDAALAKVASLAPMGGTDRILVEAIMTGTPGTDAPVRVASLVSPTTGATVRIAVLSDDPPVSVMVSPLRSQGVLVQRNRTAATFRAFGPDGRPGAPLRIDGLRWIDFDSKGYLSEMRFTPNGATGRGMKQRRRIDLATGKLAAWESDGPETEENKVGDLVVTDTRTVAKSAIPVPLVQLAMEGGKPEEAGTVSTDGARPMLSPKGDAVAYLDQGVAMVRTFTRVPRKLFEDALLAQERSKIIARAKQAGLSLIMYASDMDDTYPNNSGDITDLLMPYAKDRSIFDGFNYTYGGGKMTDIAEPANTEIGYVSGPGGRAVIYSDGHVKWRSDA